MKIKEKDLQFKREPRKRKSTNCIFIHHSYSHDVSVKEIHRWHLDRDWIGVGYHFVVRTNGDIERGRPQGSVGAHAGATANSDSIGVCLLGNFEEHEPTNRQIDSLVKLINYLGEQYGELEIKGHSDVMNTSCPGRYFPWDVLRKRLKEAKKMAGKYFKDVPDDAWYADDINKMYEEGLLKGHEDGTFRPEEPITRAEHAVTMRRLIEYLR